MKYYLYKSLDIYRMAHNWCPFWNIYIYPDKIIGSHSVLIKSILDLGLGDQSNKVPKLITLNSTPTSKAEDSDDFDFLPYIDST